MAGIQTISVTLQRDSLNTPWGFRLQGGADFRSSFIVNKISAGSPADGILHRGDVILEIDQRPISSFIHTAALELVQRAGGQITFLIQRGLNSLTSFIPLQRPMSAMPWSLANATSYLERALNAPWSSPSAAAANPATCYRNRALERVPNPKPLLSQTGSPIMPGPVPSVSTKTRGYIQPPDFHTERGNLYNTAPVDASYYSSEFPFSNAFENNRNHTGSPARYQNSYGTSYRPPWKNGSNHNSNNYVPSYQKKVQASLKPSSSQRPQQPIYRPASVQPMNLVHRQYNSPMSLYSNNNVQEVMKNHVSHISRISIIPSIPRPSHGAYTVALTPSNTNYTTASTPICYIKPSQHVYGSNF